MVTGHQEIKGKLSAYLDKELPLAEDTAVREHLLDCPDCARELAELVRTMELLKGLPKVEPPPWLASRIMARVREAAEEQPGLWQRMLQPLRGRLVLEVVALVMICVTGWYLTRTNEPLLQQSVPRTEQGVEAPARALPAKPGIDGLQEEQFAEKKVAEETKDASGVNTVRRKEPAEQTGRFAHTPPEQAPVAAPAPALPAKTLSSGGVRDEFSSAPPPLADSAAAKRQDLKLQQEANGMPGHGSYSPSAGAPGIIHEESETAPGGGQLSKEKRAARPAASSLGAAARPESARLQLQMSIKEPQSAAADIEKIIAPLGGTLLQRPSESRPASLTLRLPVNRIAELLEQLTRLGKIISRPLPVEGDKESIEIVISW